MEVLSGIVPKSEDSHTHDDLGKEFLRLKRLDSLINKNLIFCVFKLVRDRWVVENIVNHYYGSLSPQLAEEVKKFLVTLKWIALQEDVNYPPPSYLGSKYALAVYLLLESGFDLRDVRKLLRF